MLELYFHVQAFSDLRVEFNLEFCFSSGVYVYLYMYNNNNNPVRAHLLYLVFTTKFLDPKLLESLIAAQAEC